MVYFIKQENLDIKKGIVYVRYKNIVLEEYSNLYKNDYPIIGFYFYHLIEVRLIITKFLRASSSTLQ